MNHISISGNLGRDAEFFDTKTGVGARFSIAVTEGKDQYKKTHWFQVSLFGYAVNDNKHKLKKGAKVLVCGKLQENTWQDQQGQKRSQVGIFGTNIYFQETAPRVEQAPQEYVPPANDFGGNQEDIPF